MKTKTVVNKTDDRQILHFQSVEKQLDKVSAVF